MLSKDDVLKVLENVNDPDSGKSITELNMVDNVTVDDGNVTVDITFPSADYPRRVKVSSDVKVSIKKLDNVKSVNLNLSPKAPPKSEQQDNKPKKQTSKPKQPQPTIEKFAKRFIAIASGKGGVGKSTITVNLAASLAKMGHKVGVLDADLYGFSVPRMLGVTGQPMATADNKILPLTSKDNIKVISMGFFVDEDEPVVWRGPLLHKAITQFMADVVWEELDFLLIDLPPGTGDATITIAQSTPSAELMVVTTPQASATHVAGRVAKLAERTNMKVIGVIENMSYYEVNGEREYIFGEGGGKQLAKSLSVPFLGEVSLKKSIRESSDNGQPIATEGDSADVSLFKNLAEQIIRMGG